MQTTISLSYLVIFVSPLIGMIILLTRWLKGPHETLNRFKLIFKISLTGSMISILASFLLSGASIMLPRFLPTNPDSTGQRGLWELVIGLGLMPLWAAVGLLFSSIAAWKTHHQMAKNLLCATGFFFLFGTFLLFGKTTSNVTVIALVTGPIGLIFFLRKAWITF